LRVRNKVPFDGLTLFCGDQKSVWPDFYNFNYNLVDIKNQRDGIFIILIIIL
jgi:hypothetical protein